MTGKKTHEQPIAIIEERVNTKNADKDFDPRPDLERAERGAAPPSPRGTKSASAVERPDEHPAHRGLNQESQHNKKRGS